MRVEYQDKPYTLHPDTVPVLVKVVDDVPEYTECYKLTRDGQPNLYIPLSRKGDIQTAWKLIDENPIPERADVLLMYGDGTVERSNVSHEDTEAVWWQYTNEPLDLEDRFHNV